MNELPITANETCIHHLTPAHWQVADAALVAKMLSEFSHEGLLDPESEGGAWYRLIADDGETVYRFEAQRFALYHWHIRPERIQRLHHGSYLALDASTLLSEFHERLGMSDAVLSLYLEEIASTRYSAAFKCANERLKASDFPAADFQAIEAAMMEGHPAFVANNGRIGFSGDDFAAYAPEAAAPIRLVWIAGHRSRLTYATAADRTIETHLADELGQRTRTYFDERLMARGLSPEDYQYLPVHPWQWQHKLVFAFADEIASGHLVYLGFGADAYQAQQSVRTLFNRDVPSRCYVKMSLSILNMGFSRGLSPYYMGGTPAITDWLADLVAGDAYLQEKGFSTLREVAAVGYRHPRFDAALPRTDGANKMLSALWRESPVTRIGEGESLMTMAALLHRDTNGSSVLAAFIEAAGVGVQAWVDAWLDAYMSPILHCFYAHDLVFMPHGENLILVMRNHQVDRVIMKDIAEEIAVMNPDADLPADVQRIAVPVPEDLRMLSIFTDLFDLIFRFVAPILSFDCGYPEQQFWQRVARCIERYQQAHPEFATKFEAYDLFAPDFACSCVNRLQLANNQQLLDLADPTASLQFHGRLTNPVAAISHCVQTA
ncbi:IucA/IucC family siderophore biosynthesis protein [Salinisphaera sp. USBA-960]|uniref:IucA/IucC family protein n=1 Tax=Salinisphaera orenii TaxID=856731 RepID=UPI000DBE06F7|nr:IucA/IucC family siderophore biosynthesis protein [Salifodinibacter halophilus]NNC26041.1 IucA/IucC family siderophore biosynthesis protein [Salifodinibacter halophilus]